MNRRSVGGFRRSRGMGGGGAVPPLSAQLVSLLGSNLVAFWDAASGVAASGSNVVSWTAAVGGHVSSPTGGGAAPTYGVDTANFKGKPVVQYAPGAQYMAAPTVGLVAAGGRPYIFCVFRFRNTAGSPFYPYIVNIPADRQVLYSAGAGGNYSAQFKTSFGTTSPVAAPVLDTAQHSAQFWLDGTDSILRFDGTTVTAPNNGSIVAAVDSVEFSTGAPSSGGVAGNLSLACVGICTVAPTAGQRTSLDTLLSAYY